MSLATDTVGAWRTNVERASPIRAADPTGSGASLSPWQALMASAALASTREGGGSVTSDWRARIETGPAAPSVPVVDDPERIETAEARDSTPAAPNPEPPGLFEGGEFSLADLVDVINPLQHIPIVSTIYRELTGDRIGHGARLAGDVLFMGPFGGLSALANIIMLEASGKDIGDHALALLKDDPAQAPALAANADSKPEAGADEKALAELLPPDALAPNIQDPAANPAPGYASWRHAPPGAIPISGRSVEFMEAALRPAALAPTPAPSVADDDLPPPPPSGPIAGPGWKGFYSPPESPAEAARVPPMGGPSNVPPEGRPVADWNAARRAYAPDPMAALAAKRTPGAMAGAFAAPSLPPGSLAAEGGWFSDAMLAALAKYEDARRLHGPQEPEAARQGAVNIVN